MAGPKLVIAGLLSALTLWHGDFALAEELAFGPDLHQAGWRTVTFPGIAPASFKAAGRTSLEVSTDSGGRTALSNVDRAQWQARKAHWRWRVRQGAPATDLTTRGADDRALGRLLRVRVRRGRRQEPDRLLGSATVTALVYVFGGDKARGRMLPSPHMGERGKFIVLRPADTQKSVWLDEDVDLAADHLRAFARPAPFCWP